MSNAPKFNMLLPFDTDDEQFMRGFECGRVWDLLGVHIAHEDAFPTDPVTVHATNAEMFIRMAEAMGVRAVAEPLDETWIELRFEAADA